MATVLTNINWALVDEKINSALRFGLPNRDLFSMRVMKLEDNAKENDVVRVLLGTDPTVASKTLGSTGAATGALTGVNVTLGTPRAATWSYVEGSITPEVFAADIADKIAGAMYGLSKAVLDAALAFITRANFGNTEDDKVICAPADFTIQQLGQLWAKGSKKIRQRARSLMLNADYAAAVMGNGSLASVFAQASGTNPLATGILPELMGFPTATYADMPSNSEGLGGAVIGQAAIALAVAPIVSLMASGEGDIIDRRVVTHEDTGFAALYTLKGDGGGTVTAEVACMYGAAKGQDAVVRLVTE
jgi:hypothetical protein